MGFMKFLGGFFLGMLDFFKGLRGKKGVFIKDYVGEADDVIEKRVCGFFKEFIERYGIFKGKICVFMEV